MDTRLRGERPVPRTELDHRRRRPLRPVAALPQRPQRLVADIALGGVDSILEQRDRARPADSAKDAGDPDLETFNPLFPKVAYFSEASLIGPLNHIDVQPGLALRATEELTAALDWDFFWRESREDGLYRAAGLPIVGGERSLSRYVGSQLSVRLEWIIDGNGPSPW